MGFKFQPFNLKIKGYDYDKLYNEKSNEVYDAYGEEQHVGLSEMSLLQSDEEEVKEGKQLKTLTPNKLLIKLPILLAQIKGGSNSYKLKNKTRNTASFVSA